MNCKKVSEYDQEIPQSQTADNPIAFAKFPLCVHKWRHKSVSVFRKKTWKLFLCLITGVRITAIRKLCRSYCYWLFPPGINLPRQLVITLGYETARSCQVDTAIQLLTNNHIYHGLCRIRRNFKSVHNRNFNRYINQHLTVIILEYCWVFLNSCRRVKQNAYIFVALV